jgi:hypothetical protein
LRCIRDRSISSATLLMLTASDVFLASNTKRVVSIDR